jgi:acetyltransferase-like isoleucine patch superfamily enzyme
MKARQGVAALASGMAHVLAAAVRLLRIPSGPVARLWRLAFLRAHSRGHVPVSTQFDGRVAAVGGGTLRLGERCRLGHGVLFDTAGDGAITLGSHVRVNAGTVIAGSLSVSIGDDTLIGEYVSIRDANHGLAPGTLIRSQSLEQAPIRIGKDVWIGRGCCILKGVTIGDGAVVGANSVVTGDLEAGSIHAGAPARKVGMRRLSGLAD